MMEGRLAGANRDRGLVGVAQPGPAYQRREEAVVSTRPIENFLG